MDKKDTKLRSSDNDEKNIQKFNTVLSRIISNDFITELNGIYDAINYQYSKDSKEEIEAFIEGVWWMTKGFYYESQNIYERQPYVMLMLAQELFIKALLAENNVYLHTHEVDILFSKLHPKTQDKLVKKIEVHRLGILDKNGKELMIIKDFNDYINFISKYFIDLRYDYEKISKDKPVTIPRHFINNLTYELFNECYDRYKDSVIITE